ncbi:DUF1361 domain-containing protein [Flavobacterium wongokense]|uniref:DUF1361 domain-containing protein n=1 Tax=Flavobacterium wongokense TaxID=2910674 RepID=UPI001F45B472|nr:DUF1361 domain-containing protein [Flavobacterium sp. WG47]MCF6133214.1 DUF1361 domain-containing protein [Flavobacterium sp. WG47]
MNKILSIYLFNKKQNPYLIVLGVLSITLMLLRVKITQDMYLLFLIWNLFLGYIPYFLSSEIKTTVPGTYKFYLLFLGWLLFLPNAFYLLTDFVHLHHNSDLQYLFDALLLACFSIAGFYAGISSMLHIHGLLEMKYSVKKCWRIIATLCYLSSFGVYLGRILRFNSWDIVSSPIDLFFNILKSIESLHAYEFTFLFGTFILIVYGISYLSSDTKTIAS